MKRLDPKDPHTLGPYSLVARLGSGGMGVVYLAAKGADRVALKVVRGSFLDDPSLRSRFLREVSTLRKINHPNVAKVLDSDTDDEIAWLAIEYVNGADLKTIVEDKGPLSEARWFDLASGLLKALVAVHAEGVVHRDIKPANVLIEADHPKLIDFGISQISDETSITTTGLVAGSPAWLAPEQLEGGELSPAADMFSLGSLLVYAAKGQSPWGETSTMPVPVTFNKILNSQPDISGLTAAQQALVEPLLRSNPTERPTAKKALSLIGVGQAEPSRAEEPEPAGKEHKKTDENSDDGRFLPHPHKGVQRKWVRDHVDGQWSFAEFLLPVGVGVMIATFLPSVEAQASAIFLFWLFLLLTGVNLMILAAAVTGGLRFTYGASNVEKGVRWYAIRRALHMRVFRRPKPEVATSSQRWKIAAVPVGLMLSFFGVWILQLQSTDSPEISPSSDASASTPLETGLETRIESGIDSSAGDAVENTTSLFDLALGTCLDDANTPWSADLTEVPTVSCSEPHDSELFAIVSVEDGSYPGVDDLVTAGQTKCQVVFTDFVGIDFRSSSLDFHFYYPTPSSWAQGDRSIFCLVVDPGLQVVGTLQGAKR